MEMKFTKKSIARLLEEAGVKGEMQYFSEQGGVLKFVTEDGDVMSPGEAAKRFLPPCTTCGNVWPYCAHV